ncbi:MAG: FlgD immunoglobulin-like domain containing protein [Rhodothermales bacterium]
MNSRIASLALSILLLCAISSEVSAQINWVPYAGNPVIDEGFDPASEVIFRPSVLFDGATYHMWFGKKDAQDVESMGYATSPNGINWTLVDPQVLAPSSDPTRFDRDHASQGWVIADGDTLKMWYWGDGPNISNIGYAWSTDGVNWTKVVGPGLDGSVYDRVMDGGTALALGTPCVVKDGGTYHMWYSRVDQTLAFRIGYATSPDGMHWTNVPGSGTDGAVLDFGEPGHFDEHSVAWPAVIKTDQGFEMWYFGGDSFGVNRLGYATSADGIQWTQIDGNGTAGASFDEAHFAAILRQDDVYKMWYGIDFVDEVRYATSGVVHPGDEEIRWRFGFEDTWSLLESFTTEQQREDLLSKLDVVVASQEVGGDININGLAGGWNAMQVRSGEPINFSLSDATMQRLQRHRFSLLWSLRFNALWASQDNPDCYNRAIDTSCAPGPDHEDDLYDYVYALVERYDGDGFLDMGHETPNDPSDDLVVPIQFYLMTGEIEFVGATPEPDGGYGDAARNHFWSDTVENLLKTHRIVYRAVHDADPSGFSKVVSSGGIFWDLYSDFPDWPATEGPTVQARLGGDNNHNATYVESFNRLKQMLTSFGDDSDGVECDLVGWHPHMPWREVEQAFTFIKTYAGDKPIYVDDMWCNIFLQDRADAPGNTLFTGARVETQGDFPNAEIPGYTALKVGVFFSDGPVRAWYYKRHAHTLVKAFVSVFGEGAERASVSGIADFGLVRASPVGFVDLMGTPAEDFFEKPGYYTYKLLVDKLHDFESVEELPVSNDPRTRAYKFSRPERGPIYVLWSETGGAPPDLDYSIPTGETVTLSVEGDTLAWTHLVTEAGQTEPVVETLITQNRQITLHLGYEPVILEPVSDIQISNAPSDDVPAGFGLEAAYPNPFSSDTRIQFRLDRLSVVRLEIIDVLGRRIRRLVDRAFPVGYHRLTWDGLADNGKQAAAGVYVVYLRVQNSTGVSHTQTRTVVKIR